MKTESVLNSMEKIIVELMTNQLLYLELIAKELKKKFQNVLTHLMFHNVITKETPLLNVKEMMEMPPVTVNKKDKEKPLPMEISED